ncbi:PAS domain S-box protein [Thermosyntropha sp.]|uniref:PAS domain S-box protein n=1 Tax=Thermosyntropha sp. TaxID=2740820 RepID=UPI0025D176D0|nr:PAS domain S-box protein [Thermosyntropha sp.]MBO8158911.1 PAS domain S-box protein [Thermosyntropha sp.]
MAREIEKKDEYVCWWRKESIKVDINYDFEISVSKIIESWKRSDEYRKWRLLEFLGVPVVIYDRKGKILDVNIRGALLLGYKRNELLGQNFFDIVVAEESLEEEVCLKTDEIVYLKSKNGSYLPFFMELFKHEDICISFLIEAEGYPDAKKALLILEQRYKSILEHALEGICIIGKEGFLATNEVFCQIFGYDKDEVLRLSPLDFVREEERKKLEYYLEVLFDHQLLVREKIKHHFLRKDRMPIYCEVSYFSTMYEGEFAVQLHIRNVEEMEHYKQMMCRFESGYMFLLENSPEPINIIYENNIIFANRKFCSITGYTLDELKKLKKWEWIAPEYRRSFAVVADKCKNVEQEIISFTADVVTKNGTRIPAVLKLVSLFYNDKPAVMVSLKDLDIEESSGESYEEKRLKNDLVKRIFRIIAESKCADEAFFDIIKCFAEEIPDYSFEIYIYNDDIVNIYTIRQRKNWFSTIHDKKVCDIIEGLEERQFVEYYLSGKINRDDRHLWEAGYDYAVKMPLKGVNGKIGLFKWAYKKDKINVNNWIIAEIVSEISIAIETLLYREKMAEIMRREAEKEQNELFQRFAIIGDIAQSIAHEVRNPMTTVRGLAQMLAVDDPKNKDFYNMMIEEVDKADNIIHAFLRLSRDIITEKKETDINHLLDKALIVMRRELMMRGVNLVRKGSGDVCKVYVDIDQIEQVLINILRNALEASDSGSTITVETGREQNFIYIIFTDEGRGIDEDNLKRVIEPFFTTKDVNTGLGLSISYKIIKEHGGEIILDSKLNQGTRVKICLPCAG